MGCSPPGSSVHGSFQARVLEWGAIAFSTHLNAEFQRIARRDEKTFLRDRCKEIEENNRMGKTRDLFMEKEMATHSGVLAWRIPGMGEPGGLPSMGSHRVGHD